MIARVLLILLLFVTQYLKGQLYFDYRHEADQIAYAATTLPFDRLLIVGTSGNLATRETNAWLMVVGQQGEFISEFNYGIPGHSLKFKFVRMVGLDIALLATEITNLTTYRTRAALMKVSLLQAESPSLLQLQYWGDTTDHIELLGIAPDGFQDILMFGKDNATTDGVILRGTQKILWSGNGQQAVSGMAQRPNAQGWLALISEYEAASLHSVVYLNTQLQVEGSQPLPEGIYDAQNPEWRNDSSWYCIAARKFCLDAPTALRPKDIVLVQGQLDSGIVQLNCMGTVNQNDKPGGMAMNREGNQVLLSWTPAHRIFMPQSQGYSRNQIPLCLTDTLGVIQAQAMLGESAYYEVHHLSRPTYGTDGKSWLIAGSRYDIWNSQTGTDAFWMIFQEGTALQAEANWNPESILFSPNPVSRQFPFLKFMALKGTFNIWDLQGRLVQAGNLMPVVELVAVEAGVYILEIITDQGSLKKKLMLQ
jgi:hypothetical protein